MGRTEHQTLLGGGPSYQSILDTDSRRVPDALRESSPPSAGAVDLSTGRYTDPQFFLKEVEAIWRRTWQMACREEDIPKVGDCHVFELTGKSLIVTRTASDTIRAFVNSCLHRGRKLMTQNGNRKELRCPYHGFCWKLDGSLSENPIAWDFPGRTDDDWRLPEVRCERWGGFVFVNFDGNATPLAKVIDPVPRHFQHWPQEDRYKAVHVSRIVRANWKVVAEAFMESHHALTTHPQILPFTADANSQYDILSDHVTRHISAAAVPSPFVAEKTRDNDVLNAMLAFSRRGAQMAGDAPSLPPGMTTRAFMAEGARRMLGAADQADYASRSDAEMLDSILYNMFPNLSVWAGVAPNLVYRWRPNGMDHSSTVMDVMILKPVPKSGERPAAATVHVLREDEPWASATELGALGAIFDQDMSNLPHVQDGLAASGTGIVRLSAYLEGRIAHHHRMIDVYMSSCSTLTESGNQNGSRSASRLGSSRSSDQQANP